ncbi:MAG: ATP-binding protein [Verrucomicrobiota bacterium]
MKGARQPETAPFGKRRRHSFRRLVESLPPLIWTFEANGECDYLSPQWTTFTGRPLSNLLGLGWLESLHSEDRSSFLTAWNAAVASGESFQTEVRIRKHDGSYRWFEARAMPWRSRQGAVLRWAAANTDITVRRRAEERLRQVKNTLENAVKARTGELAAVNQELETFAYSVAHDLGAPLRHINRYTALLLKSLGGRLDPTDEHHLRQLADSTERMEKLIDDLLEFSLMNRCEMCSQRVALRRLAEEAIRTVRSQMPGSSIVFRRRSLPLVHGDPAMLRQVFVNLLSNAAKFSSRRRPARIEVGAAIDQVAETVVFVRDNGVGFDMRYAEKIFNLFQRLHSKDEFEGSGIGLATVRRIIQRHGGRTWAEAKPNEGAIFYFALPRKAATGTRP